MFAESLPPMPEPPSNLASSRCNNDSWFAAHASRQPISHPAVANNQQFNDYVAEYNAKYEVYHRLHQEMSAVHRFGFCSAFCLPARPHGLVCWMVAVACPVMFRSWIWIGNYLAIKPSLGFDSSTSERSLLLQQVCGGSEGGCAHGQDRGASQGVRRAR
jgi:hypothetical protein